MNALPLALDAFLREHFPEQAARLRALHAPVPALGFRSALDEAGCWASGGDDDPRAKFERTLVNEKDSLNDGSLPYFAVEGTGGSMTSPYTELSDGAWWRFVQLWGTEDAATLWLTKRMPSLDGKSGIELLGESPGLFGRLLGKREPPLIRVWNAHLAQIAGNYR